MRAFAFAVLLACSALLPAAGQEFQSAAVCSLCHRLNPGAPFPLWRGSMMAQAGADPYWHAKVASEVAKAPARKAEIEALCNSCHIPAKLVNEGVTCTVCHRIEKADPGRFVLTREPLIYGPHDRPFAMPMLHHTGLEPVESRHMLDAALCGACHTVKVGDFYEQAPLLEWTASDFAGGGTTCQSCHLPELREEEYIAHRPPGGPFPPTRPRKPVGQHFFIGGNYQVSAAMKREDTSRRAREFLDGAASLELSESRSGETLLIDVQVINNAGHKLPTAYPSRRMWVHLRVAGAAGQTVFESGRESPAGLPAHYRAIDSPSQVMVYEGEMADAAGKPTTSLVSARGWAKDNRILPSGFDASKLKDQAARRSLAPAGVEADADFVPGSDTVRYKVRAPQAGGPYRVSVELLYENIKPSHRVVFDAPAAPARIAAAELVSGRSGTRSAARRVR